MRYAVIYCEAPARYRAQRRSPIHTKAARHGVLVHVNGLQVNEPIHAGSALHCLDHQVAGAVVKRFAHQQRTGLKRQRRLQKCEAAQAHTANSRSANPRKVWPMPSVRKAPSASMHEA